MNNANRLVRMMIGCVVLTGGSLAFAQDWPQWRGPDRDGKVTGFIVPAYWPQPVTEKWKTPVGLGDATPALVGERLYVFARQGDDEVALCLDAKNGKELWRDKYAAQAVTGAAAAHPGPRSSPTVADGKVITLGVGGILSCLDAATGKLVWRKDEFPNVVPQFFSAMSPIVVDGLCIAHLGGKDQGAIIAVDLATGNEKWRWTGDGPAYASPVVMTVDGVKQIGAQTDKSLVGVAAADGKLLWQVAAPSQGRFFNSATPIVDGQTVIYTGQGKGTKAVKIERQGDHFVAAELWANETVGTGYNTPVLNDGLLFGLSDKGNFFCIDAKTGQTNWIDATRHDNFCAILDVGSAILGLLGKTSEIIAFRPNGARYEELAQVKVSDTPTYAHPVLSGNRAFIKDKDNLTLLTVE